MLQIFKYEIEIEIKSGLYIGSGNNSIQIGGVDNDFIKDNNKLPYIPGSSLKGKLRSLLELSLIDSSMMEDYRGDIFGPKEYKNSKDNKEDILLLLKMFGTSASNNVDKESDEYANIDEFGFTRLSVEDFYISDEDRTKQDIFEIKTEVNINRKNGTPISGARNIERVRKGIKFVGNLSLKLFNDDLKEKEKNTDIENDYIKLLMKALHYLELDALGGSTSRGYGRVGIRFVNDTYQKKYEETQI